MTTARTHRRNIGRGSHRPLPAAPKPESYVPISAEAFASAVVFDAPAVVIEDFDYDPADHTTDEVKEFVLANPTSADTILELELEGKARSGLLTWLDNFDTESEN